MGLAFRGAGPDRRPTDQVGGVLWTDRIEQLCAAGKAQLIDLEENGPSQLHPRRDIAGAIEMRIINQAFPSDGGSWFFKVSPHHDQETVTQGIGNRLQLGGILIGGVGVMDGAWSYNDQEPVSIFSMENSANRFASFDDECRSLIGNRQFGLNGARGWQRLDFNNMLVVDRSIHEEVCPSETSFLLRSWRG
jgi:hypothetical protein